VRPRPPPRRAAAAASAASGASRPAAAAASATAGGASRLAAAAVAPPPAAPDAPSEPAAPPAGRDVCRRCGRALCICAHLPADGGADVATRFIVVQSRRERFNALSTGRLVQLGLRGCTLVWDVDNDEELPPPPDMPPGTGVLFPGAGATLLGPGAGAPPALVVVDGTWAQATRMLRKNAWLGTLPRYAFAPGPAQESNYRIRKQPKAHCLSTVECVARVLQAVEPGAGDAAAARLLGAFDALVESQLACLADATRSHRFHARRPRTKPADALARRGITAQPPPVVAYGEYLRGSLVQWVALRVATGDVFHAYVLCGAVRDQRGGPDSVLRPLGAPAGAGAADGSGGALSPAAFDAAWRAWLRPGERPAVWSLREDAMHHALGAAAAEAGVVALPPHAAAADAGDDAAAAQVQQGHALSLKEAYAALRSARARGAHVGGPGALSDAVAAEAGAAEAAAAATEALRGRVTGRAGERLAHTAGMAAAMSLAAAALQAEADAAASAAA
jgi:DTW domain-containing protein YfiP